LLVSLFLSHFPERGAPVEVSLLIHAQRRREKYQPIAFSFLALPVAAQAGPNTTYLRAFRLDLCQPPAFR